MANTMDFSLVSPERSLVSGPVSEVQIPGTDGDLTAMPGHAPMITTLRPGLLHISGPNGEDDYVVTGGFAEISAEGVTVLAERALHQKEMTQDILNDWVVEARKAWKDATDDNAVAHTAKLLADMVAMGTHVGLDPDHANYYE
ncbi:F0F1 ATP synthase subunit epsilon [Pseudooceanicola sediminis]|uniref:ATP synthase epsilon chain n=1 Tax=Pseudooceanicola sediminis TaxID=2211117 RepID=A0A399J0N5_9RHOB|nr:F0F1 ATP synthase subunit epsilon [Pseudooceanicola sediminis]KAA2312383.1 F0F1 ATP synthase subunit epsilon [Puniceibacterium sp. HSS470]RII37432.1 F0F1 ATP synthase subunit epsilon [Pseudooceanicola sediminis]|tara:strand:- start:11908 stop:12336 length:429 start_codon:yes stop_codon:yes gene_type:complete